MPIDIPVPIVRLLCCTLCYQRSGTKPRQVHFQDGRVQKKYLDFFERLKAFVDYFGMHSSPERFGSVMLQSVIPANQFDEMNVAPHHQAEINEVNRLATEALKAMRPLITEIKERIPEVFDEQIRGGWIRSPEE